MASLYWQGDTETAPNTWSTAGNWSTGSAPADGDDVYVDHRGASSAINGEDQSTIEPAAIWVTMGFTQSIGDHATPLQITPVRLYLGDGDGFAPRPVVWNFGFGADPCFVTVNNSHPMGRDGLPPILLAGTNVANTLSMSGGYVGLGLSTVGEDHKWAQISVSGGRLIIGKGCTQLTSVNVYGNAHVITNTAITTLRAGPGAIVETRGAVKHGTVVLAGGTVIGNNVDGSDVFCDLLERQHPDSVLNFRMNHSDAVTITATMGKFGRILASFPSQVIHSDNQGDGYNPGGESGGHGGSPPG